MIAVGAPARCPLLAADQNVTPREDRWMKLPRTTPAVIPAKAGIHPEWVPAPVT